MTESNQQEEKVIEELKLIEKNYWNQCDQIVLLVILLVRWIAPGTTCAIKMQGPLLTRYHAAEEAAQSIACWQGFYRLLLLSQQRLAFSSAINRATMWMFFVVRILIDCYSPLSKTISAFKILVRLDSKFMVLVHGRTIDNVLSCSSNSIVLKANQLYVNNRNSKFN